jgi:hypothetical protein
MRSVREKLSSKDISAAKNLIDEYSVEKGEPDYDAIVQEFGQASLELEEQQRIARAPTLCASDWTKCLDNSMLVNKYSKILDIQTKCKIESDKIAKYDTKWDYPVFTIYYKGTNYLEAGEIILLDENAKFQNGFGAFKKMKLECHFDLNSQNFLYVRALNDD